MSGKSFYDLDYIIEINEQRLEQYNSAYESIMQKLTNIIVIYSAIAIFLIPIVRMVFWGGGGWMVGVCFWPFAVLFSISCIYAVRLIIPKSLLLLSRPKDYYNAYLKEYEKMTDDRSELENLVRASYIKELELLIEMRLISLQRKNSFYAIALIMALLSILPYLVCFGIYVANLKDDMIQ